MFLKKANVSPIRPLQSISNNDSQLYSIYFRAFTFLPPIGVNVALGSSSEIWADDHVPNHGGCVRAVVPLGEGFEEWVTPWN